MSLIFMVVSLACAGAVYTAAGKANFVVWFNLAAALVNAIALVVKTTGVTP